MRRTSARGRRATVRRPGRRWCRAAAARRRGATATRAGGMASARAVREGDQRAVVVEEEQRGSRDARKAAHQLVHGQVAPACSPWRRVRSLRGLVAGRPRKRSLQREDVVALDAAVAARAMRSRRSSAGSSSDPLQHRGRALLVVGVDQEGLAHLRRRPRELAQQQHAVRAALAGDVLLGHQVHPVPQRRHPAHVGRGVEGHQLGRRDARAACRRRASSPACRTRR